MPTALLFALGLGAQAAADTVWPLLQHRPDPTRRSQLIHELARTGIDPSLIMRRLDAEPDISARRALILSLGGFTAEQIPAALRKPLISKLLHWYRDDPDPGIHAAISWLLRHSRQGDRPRALDWRQAQALAQIDRELAGRPADRRDWYVTREGQTLSLVRGPVEFVMGSPPQENVLGRTPDELQHPARIPRSFAIASTEVTIAEFRRFLDANPAVRARHLHALDSTGRARDFDRLSPDDDGPQINVTWYEAAMYCNWLSRREGIPESEWVYPASFEEITSGMRLSEDHLRRMGYRLPTEAEWEYAARAGSVTARFYGDAPEPLLREYAWHRSRPPRSKDDPVPAGDPVRTWPVAQLKPNDLGMFDVYGNVWEWLHDRRRDYPTDGSLREDREDPVLVVADSLARIRRGGSFSYEPAMQRSAHRGATGYFPNQRRDNVGFRVGRSVR